MSPRGDPRPGPSRPRSSSTGGPALAQGHPRPGRAERLARAPTLLLSVVAPWAVYLILRRHVGSDTEALAIGGAIPAAWVLVRLALTRRVDWLALAAVTAFAVVLMVSVLSGGSALPLKLRYSVTTGAMGLACVVSALARRPLPLLLARVRGLYDSERASRIEQAFAAPDRRRKLTVATGLFGVTLLVDAAVRAVLAVTLPTAEFLAVSGVTSWAIVGAGVALLLIYLRRGRKGGTEIAIKDLAHQVLPGRRRGVGRVRDADPDRGRSPAGDSGPGDHGSAGDAVLRVGPGYGGHRQSGSS